MVRRMMLAAVLTVGLSLSGCATSSEPFEYQSDNRAKPGRGVFTGEDGAWTIYRKPMPAEPQAEPEEEAGDKSGAEAKDSRRETPGKPVPE